ARASMTARAYSSLASCPAVNTRADRRGGTRDGRRVHGPERTVLAVGAGEVLSIVCTMQPPAAQFTVRSFRAKPAPEFPPAPAARAARASARGGPGLRRSVAPPRSRAGRGRPARWPGELRARPSPPPPRGG